VPGSGRRLSRTALLALAAVMVAGACSGGDGGTEVSTDRPTTSTTGAFSPAPSADPETTSAEPLQAPPSVAPPLVPGAPLAAQPAVSPVAKPGTPTPLKASTPTTRAPGVTGPTQPASPVTTPQAGNPSPVPATAVQAAPTLPPRASAYPLTLRNCGVDYTFTKAPERVISPSVPSTEIMLALGLERRLAGVVGGVSVITPELQSRMAGVHVISERTFPSPSKEAVLSVNPDFLVAGYSEVFAPTAAGSQAGLKDLGVNSYLVQGKCGEKTGSEASLDDTYADIENMGKIFDIRNQASALVAQLRAEAAAVAPVTNKPKVLLWSAGREKPSTSGFTSLTDDLTRRAGGVNILPEIGDSLPFNWEAVVDRNPDVFIIVATGSFTGESAVEFALNYGPIAGVNAVKNKRFVVLAVNDVQPGIRNGRALAAIAKGLAGA